METATLWLLGGTFFWYLFGAVRAFRPAPGSRLGIAGVLPFLSFGAIMVISPRAEFSPLGAIGALVLIAIGLGLFEWGRYSIRNQYFSYLMSSDIPEFVFSGGPFAYIRNPFYLSYWLATLAGLLAFPTWASLAIVIAMTVYYNEVAKFEERKFTRSNVAASYEAYKARTGRFFPRV